VRGVYISKFGKNLIKFSVWGPHTPPLHPGGEIWRQVSVQRVTPPWQKPQNRSLTTRAGFSWWEAWGQLNCGFLDGRL